MNKYYVVYEVGYARKSACLDTVYDMNTYSGLMGVIEILEEENKSPVLIHSWKLLS
jgi:hypothetical protein